MVTDEFGKGDSFFALDEGHEKCRARSVVLGVGIVVWYDNKAQQQSTEGALTRCLGCLKSYVIVTPLKTL